VLKRRGRWDRGESKEKGGEVVKIPEEGLGNGKGWMRKKGSNHC